MRKAISIFMLVGILVGLLYIPVSAAPAPVSYKSSVSLTNLVGTSGKITFTYYNPNGSVAASINDTILGYETKLYDPLQPDVPSGFAGGLVVSSDVPLGSVSNLRGLNASNQVTHYDSFVGFSSGTGTVYLPLLMKNNWGYNTTFSVQNTGAGAANVAIAYSDATSNSITDLQPGASQTISQSTETHPGAIFSAILTTTGSIAVTVVESGSTLLTYDGNGAGSNFPLFTIVNENNYGYWSSVLVQNVGTLDTTVEITYTPTLAGTACTETINVPHGQSVTFAEYAFKDLPKSNSTCAFGARFVGSGKVTSNKDASNNPQPLVTIVQQLNPNAPENKAGVYRGFDQNAGSASIIFPFIHDRNYGFWTSWTIVNNGASIAAGAIDCHVTGKASGGTTIDMHFTNPSALGTSTGWLKENLNTIANGFVGGAICTGPAGSKLFGTVNQLGQGASYTGLDTLLVYEGINP